MAYIVEGTLVRIKSTGARGQVIWIPAHDSYKVEFSGKTGTQVRTFSRDEIVPC